MTHAPTVLLLHGLGATGAVWTNVCAVLGQRVPFRVIAPDLAGHGTAAWRAHYSVGGLAAELAEALYGKEDVLLVGHSLGVYIALALASGWFGVRVRAVVGLGPKILWTSAELASAAELAARPLRTYATREEALARYRRVSGLESHLAPAEASLARGVVSCPEGWRLAQDPRTFEVAGAPFRTLATSAQARVRLARGSNDQLVTMEQLRSHDAHAVEIPDAGHNAHVEKPEALVDLLESML